MKHTNIAKTNEEFAKEFKEKRPDLEQLSFYVSSKTKIKVRCRECLHEWWAIPSNLLRGTKCPECSKKDRAKEKTTPLETIIFRVKEIWGNLISYLSGYTKTHEKCWWQCNVCGNIWQANPHDVLAHHGCKKCADTARGKKQRIKEEELIYRIKIIHGDALTYIKGLTTTREKALFHCNECNKDFYATVSSILSGSGCPNCANRHNAESKLIPVKTIVERLYNIYKESIILDETTYVDTSTKCRFYCIKHGEFWATPQHVLHGHGCSICGRAHGGKQLRLSLEEVQQRLWELYHGDIIIDSKSFTKIDDYAIFKCTICGNIWRAKVKSVLYRKSKCSICVKKSLEIPVAETLSKKGIEFLHDISLEGSNYNGSRIPLRVDFIIETPEGKLAIETDGKQHFCPIYGEEELKTQQEHDRYKDKILKERGYILIRVTSSPTKEWGFKNHITLAELLHLIEIGIDSETKEINFELFKQYDFNRK